MAISAAALQARLQAVLSPQLEVIDESGQHMGHAGANGTGCGTHFRVRIAAPVFAGKSRVAQHRLVYDALQEFIDRACTRWPLNFCKRAPSTNACRLPNTPFSLSLFSFFGFSCRKSSCPALLPLLCWALHCPWLHKTWPSSTVKPSQSAQKRWQQVERSGRPITPEIEAQIKEEVIAREVFMQEAKKRNLESADYKAQMELARQSILIRELFADYQKKNPVTDAEIKAEYDKFVAANNGKEYKASHILVEKEEEAKAIIAAIKQGEKFEEIAKKNPKTQALAHAVATSIGPTPTATCPSSPKPCSS